MFLICASSRTVVQTPEGLRSDSAERRDDLWAVHHLRGRRGGSAHPGVLWHDHRWRRMAGEWINLQVKSHIKKQDMISCVLWPWPSLLWLLWICCDTAGFPPTPEWKAGILQELEELHGWLREHEWWVLARWEAPVFYSKSPLSLFYSVSSQLTHIQLFQVSPTSIKSQILDTMSCVWTWGTTGSRRTLSTTSWPSQSPEHVIRSTSERTVERQVGGTAEDQFDIVLFIYLLLLLIIRREKWYHSCLWGKY